MKLLSVLFSIILFAAPQSMAARTDRPVSASSAVEVTASDSVRLVFDLTMQKGWHVYSTGQKGGPTSAELQLDSISGLKLCGTLDYEGTLLNRTDSAFGVQVSYFEDRVRFYQTAVIKASDWYIEGNLTYGACNDISCLPPGHVEFTFSSNLNDAAAGLQYDWQGGGVETDLSALPDYDVQTWQPVQYASSQATRSEHGLWGLFLTSILAGFLALLTPCVWPVIPMTVSFFLKRGKEHGRSVRDSVIFGLAIIAVYVSIGLAVTLIFGADALNALATNAIVNILFFAVLVAFSLSLFGLFELRLPGKWSTGTDRNARRQGLAGIFFMALTLAIVSFSCTGPIIGFLLVDAAQNGSLLAPAVGMAGFSLALAVPFALFAAFPGWMESLPKSGAWMQKVKVTLGFIELAFSLKFLSVADMAYGWGILPRGLFILLWTVMALVLSLYFLDIYRKKKHRRSAVSTAFGIVFLAFAAWLVPGLWGAPLKAISAFCPPMPAAYEQYSDYAHALEASARTGKPVLIDFTGYGCVNCRKMEASVWTDPDVAKTVAGSYIMLSLYVDDRTPLPQTVTVTENGQKIKLRNMGDKWSLLQRYKFGANAQPFYVIVDYRGSLLSAPYTFNPDPADFLKFLSVRN